MIYRQPANRWAYVNKPSTLHQSANANYIGYYGRHISAYGILHQIIQHPVIWPLLMRKQLLAHARSLEIKINYKDIMVLAREFSCENTKCSRSSNAPFEAPEDKRRHCGVAFTRLREPISTTDAMVDNSNFYLGTVFELNGLGDGYANIPLILIMVQRTYGFQEISRIRRYSLMDLLTERLKIHSISMNC
ncbi:hypothetical protein OR60_19100 [Xanthomonas vesicatoria]|uniref:Uncharacterized protein n=1 Tax=Xanthomonas vesicatoria TaxID=56460 RepID=A0AAJ0IV45_9XANT|nr:hypothetical protein OR61_19755 [Xanthomonas vesicatoria]KHM91626.1 hypothetical protein OR60_19100 [Xanthomonas vesicatoria]